MADQDTIAGSLALTASLYQTRVTTVTITAIGPFRVLAANGNRWAVMFSLIGVGSLPALYPGPLPAVPPGANATWASPAVFTFRDAPSWVTGEWYVSINPSGTQIVISECIYLR